MLLLLGVILIPTLIENGDIADLITVLPFGGQIFDMLATVLNFGSQFPKMSTVVDVWPEILKVFFVAVTKKFISNVFSAFLDDRDHKTHGILVRAITDLAVVCLASLFFQTIWSLLKTFGIIAFILAILIVNCLFAAKKATGMILGKNGVLMTLLIELLSDIAQTFFVMVIVIGICILLISPSINFFATGLIYIISGLILLIGIKLILDS